MKAKAYIVHRAMCEPELEWSKPKDCLSADPLYTTPPQHLCKFPLCQNEEYQQALAEQITQELYTGTPQRKPLTDADIKLVMDGRGEEGDEDYIKPAFDPYGISEGDLIDFARAIEQAHGIGEKT